MKYPNTNPWENIALSDYENHMKLESVQQLQTMNRMMRDQFRLCAAESVMVLGVAGGNGLEHAVDCGFKHVYGVDINPDYLHQCQARYPQLHNILECICTDLSNPDITLPHADLLIANLLIEYIGYECFCNVVSKIRPACVSCIIQINTDDSFVSDSPYLHVFDGLDSVHHQMQEDQLTRAMASIGYHLSGQTSCPLPNGKKLIELDYTIGGM